MVFIAPPQQLWLIVFKWYYIFLFGSRPHRISADYGIVNATNARAFQDIRSSQLLFIYNYISVFRGLTKSSRSLSNLVFVCTCVFVICVFVCVVARAFHWLYYHKWIFDSNALLLLYIECRMGLWDEMPFICFIVYITIT